MSVTTRRERVKVVGVHVVVGSGTVAHVVSLVAIIVAVIDHVVVGHWMATGGGMCWVTSWRLQYTI